MRTRNNYFQEASSSDSKVYELHRNEKGWYFKIWFIKIYLDSRNAFFFNDLLRTQNGHDDGNPHILYLLIISDVRKLQINWNKFTQYYKINQETNASKYTLFDIPFYFCNKLDMKKSEPNAYFVKHNLGLDNRIYNVPIKFNWFLDYFVVRKLFIKNSIYIKL